MPGKIFIIVKVRPDSRFEREGDNLSGEVSVSITEAALGAEVPVVTLDGEQIVRIPPATPSGRKLRLSGKGFAKRKGGRGDLYVRIKIVPPPEPNDEERALLEELGKIASFDPRNDA